MKGYEKKYHKSAEEFKITNFLKYRFFFFVLSTKSSYFLFYQMNHKCPNLNFFLTDLTLFFSIAITNKIQ